jgi:sialic acid synthase SpsE
MELLVRESERAFLALGNVQLCIQKEEEKSKIFKRSLYVVKNIAKGEVFTKENVRAIRPGDGLEPKYLEGILGQKSKIALKRGTPMSINYLD